MKDLIAEARELYDGWAAYDIMRHGGGQGAKSDDGEAERKFMLWIADEFPAMCDALEKATEKNEELMRELAQLARESVEREKTLARLEAEVECALEKAARWIPVTEHRPKIGEAVLTVRVSAIYKARYIDILRFEGSHWRDGGSGPKVLLSQVSHWMPLPAAPEEGAQHE